MRIASIQLSKNAKVGLPRYSNITVGTTITWELAEGEKFDYTKAWDIINQQLDIQIDAGIDPSWIHQNETKGTYKTVISTPKGKDDTTDKGRSDQAD